MAQAIYDYVVRTLSGTISGRIINIPDEIKEKVQEIRVRVNRPLTLCCQDENLFVTSNGCLTNAILDNKMLMVGKKEICEIFNNLCNYSVYSKQNEIKNGFITINGGHRAGICGTAIVENNKITNIRDISSINIRIAREHKGCCKEIINRINISSGGLLICGAPCSGKTTILRDLARVLSIEKSMKVALIDSRSEISGTYKGIFQKDIGLCDVLDGYNKKDGFDHAIRCLSPDVIICDEIGSNEDLISIENAINSGITVIATAHCSNKKELLLKDNLKKSIKNHSFKTVVFLKGRKNAGEISNIITDNEFSI